MQKLPDPLKIIAFIFLFGAQHAVAEDYQIHGRTGILDAMVGGVKGIAPFMSMPIFDGEFEFLKSTKKSYLVHGTFAQDMTTAQTKYFYAGYGERYYVWGTVGTKVDKLDKTGVIQIQGSKRYYIDWEIGMGQLQAEAINLSLNITSTVLEIGLAGGMIYQPWRNLGLVTHVGLGYGYGISSVAVSGMIARILFGVTYYL